MSKAETVPYFVKCSFFSTFQQGQFIKGLGVELWIQPVKRYYRALSFNLGEAENIFEYGDIQIDFCNCNKRCHFIGAMILKVLQYKFGIILEPGFIIGMDRDILCRGNLTGQSQIMKNPFGKVIQYLLINRAYRQDCNELRRDD